MSSANKYHVVKFLEVPSSYTEEWACVPDSWVKYDRNQVKVAYPTKPSYSIYEMIRKHEKSLSDWSEHLVDIKYTTEYYEEAINYINKDKTIEKLVNDVNDLSFRMTQLETKYDKLLCESGSNTPITPSQTKDNVKSTAKTDFGNSSPIASSIGEKVKRKIQPTDFGSNTPTATSSPKGDESLNNTYSEYDHEDLSWTLKYNKNSEELEELVKGSGVYIAADDLKDIKKYNTEMMTSKLLNDIFTKEALEICTYTGKNSKRPALHHNASKYLIQYVLENGFNSDGSRPMRDSVINVIRNELKKKNKTTK